MISRYTTVKLRWGIPIEVAHGSLRWCARGLRVRRELRDLLGLLLAIALLVRQAVGDDTRDDVGRLKRAVAVDGLEDAERLGSGVRVGTVGAWRHVLRAVAHDRDAQLVDELLGRSIRCTDDNLIDVLDTCTCTRWW